MENLSEKTVRRLAMGDERALSFLYRALKMHFFPLAHWMLKDEHEAQEAFDDAFLKFYWKVSNGSFSWKGKAQLFAYFKRTLTSSCLERIRNANRRQRMEGPLPTPSEEGVDQEELIPDPIDPIEEESIRASRAKAMREAADALKRSLSPRERTVFEAYKPLSEIPESRNWTEREKTAFLQQCSGLKENKFYINHSRMKAKAEQILKTYKLIR